MSVWVDMSKPFFKKNTNYGAHIKWPHNIRPLNQYDLDRDIDIYMNKTQLRMWYLKSRGKEWA